MMRDPFEKHCIFVTGAPRSGTSILTKVIDSHPDVAILMENIFGNRRRHWKRAEYWCSSKNLAHEVSTVFSLLHEPVVGNKVCTPDVWSAEDIHQFCRLFRSFKIVFMIRNPLAVALSRQKRSWYQKSFNEDARKNLLLDFRSPWNTYISSWRQSIENYWKFRDAYHDQVQLLYYEDFCNNFEEQAKYLFRWLALPFSENILQWYTIPHHDSQGQLKRDLKYPDNPVYRNNFDSTKAPKELLDVLRTIFWQFDLWQKREL